MTKLDDRFSRSTTARARAGMLAALLCLAALVAMPSVAAAYHNNKVGGFAVGMPDDETSSKLAPGDTVVVTLTPSARAREHHRVAVVTLARRGDHGLPSTLLARSRLAGGTFSAQIPPARDGTYVLRVQVVDPRVRLRAFTEATFDVSVVEPVSGPCGELADDVSAELGVSNSKPRPGGKVNLSLANTGPGCLTTGYGFVWQVSRGGTWVDVPLNLVVPAVLVSLKPGTALQDTFPIPANTAPGQYRIVKHFRAAGEDDELSVELQVVARHRHGA
jgi:hypothetical protein